MQVTVTDGNVELPGDLSLPESMRGAILFAHGSGSSRLSVRNRQVARTLNDRGFATLLFDLLTEEESHDRRNVFDIDLLANRLEMATRWLREQSRFTDTRLGYFGASTGAAAALQAAAELGTEVSAVVSRGGRPDLTGPSIRLVASPTLLIVGGEDHPVIELNQEAMNSLVDAKLVLIPGATHLFEEPGALEEVARYAGDWFEEHVAHMPRKKRAA